MNLPLSIADTLRLLEPRWDMARNRRNNPPKPEPAVNPPEPPEPLDTGESLAHQKTDHPIQPNAEPEGPQQHLKYDFRTFLSDQVESFGFFLFSLGQASVLAGIGVLAGKVIPAVHDHAATWAGLSEEKLTKWDETHHSLGRFLEDTFHGCALALLCMGVVVIVLTAGRTLYRWYRKLPPPTIRSVKVKLRDFGWNSLGSAGIFAALCLVSMLLNIITAYPLALLLPRAPLTAQIGGWLLTGLEGVLLLFGLIFAFLQSLRSARRFINHGSTPSSPSTQPPSGSRPPGKDAGKQPS